MHQTRDFFFTGVWNVKSVHLLHVKRTSHTILTKPRLPAHAGWGIGSPPPTPISGPLFDARHRLCLSCDPQDPGVFDALTQDGMQFHFRDEFSGQLNPSGRDNI